MSRPENQSRVDNHKQFRKNFEYAFTLRCDACDNPFPGKMKARTVCDDCMTIIRAGLADEAAGRVKTVDEVAEELGVWEEDTNQSTNQEDGGEHA